MTPPCVLAAPRRYRAYTKPEGVRFFATDDLGSELQADAPVPLRPALLAAAPLA